jgi:hypothetical protein
MNKILILILFIITSCKKEQIENSNQLKTEKSVIYKKKRSFKSQGSDCNINLEFITKDSLYVKIDETIFNGKIIKSPNKTDYDYNLYNFIVDDTLVFTFNNDLENLFIANDNYRLNCGAKIIDLY